MSNSLDALTFADLFRRARRGDLAAGTALIRLARPALESIIHRRPRSCTRRLEDDEDIVLETLVKYFREADDGRLPEDPACQLVYLFHMAGWQAATANRDCGCKKRALDLTAETLSDNAADRLPSAQPGPEAQAMFEDEWEWLLSRLEPPGREILGRFRQGLDAKAIAAELHVSESTVRRRLRAAQDRWRLRRDQDR